MYCLAGWLARGVTHRLNSKFNTTRSALLLQPHYLPVHNPPCLLVPFHPTRSWVEGTALLHDLHQQEAGESLATALQHGTYSKASPFVC